MPYTSKNGSASILLEARGDENLKLLASKIEAVMRADFIDGSDPGLCITNRHITELTEFGRRCQREVVCKATARELAAKHKVFLRGLGGTEDGVIGALAAVGLAMTADDGRIVQRGESPEELSGLQSVETLLARGVVVRKRDDDRQVRTGMVDVGKKLRPNLRDQRFVLFVEPATAESTEDASWLAVKLP